MLFLLQDILYIYTYIYIQVNMYIKPCFNWAISCEFARALGVSRRDVHALGNQIQWMWLPHDLPNQLRD